ncbi:MAG: class I SAM-dependent methyltransferase [Oligoflexia bacterium]|nr:class I SAM-dependent methyltransferase [Oligoflexia bacterium]
MKPEIYKVREQYEKYPYPEPALLAYPSRSLSCHAAYEVGAALTTGKLASHAGKRIALIGCGTQEPLIMAKLHPKAHVTAIDVSKKSLRQAKLSTQLWFCDNIEFVHNDLESFAIENEGRFDYVHCYGVVHHLPSPQRGISAVAQLLSRDGFARLMVYAESSRRRINGIKRVAKMLGLSAADPESPFLIQRMIESLPENHPLRITFSMHTERHSTAGLVDAFLHACENPLTLSQLVESVGENSCFIHDWDLSLRSIEMINDAPGDNLYEKIKWLELSTQWPGHWVFWMSKLRHPINANRLAINPAFRLRPFRTSHTSGILRQKIEFDPEIKKLLHQLQSGPIPLEKAHALVDSKRLSLLTAARLVLEVGP